MANTEPGPSLRLTANDLKDPTRLNRILGYIQAAIGQPQKAKITSTTIEVTGGGGGGGNTYIYTGSGGGWKVLSIVSNAVSPDLHDGTNFKLVMNQKAQVTVNNIVYTGSSLSYGQPAVLYPVQDSVGGRPQLAWGSAFGDDVKAWRMSIDPNARNGIGMRYWDDNLWHLDWAFEGY